MSSWFCSLYIYTEYFLFQTLLVIFVFEKLVHFCFIRNVTFLLVSKEDLIMAILWIVSIGIGLLSTFVKFYGLIKLPMTYHMCTGLPVPAAYMSPLAVKCDSDNITFETFIYTLYCITFLLFGCLVIHKSIRKQRQTRQQVNPRGSTEVILSKPISVKTESVLNVALNPLKAFYRIKHSYFQESRLQILVDNKPFILRTVYAIVVTQLFFKYNELSSGDLTSYPGYFIVYAYHFVTLPVFLIIITSCYIIGHESLRNHLRRRFRLHFGQTIIDVKC